MGIRTCVPFCTITSVTCSLTDFADSLWRTVTGGYLRKVSNGGKKSQQREKFHTVLKLILRSVVMLSVT
jgi:hypothetical protein